VTHTILDSLIFNYIKKREFAEAVQLMVLDRATMRRRARSLVGGKDPVGVNERDRVGAHGGKTGSGSKG
jgi:hypothetical protein